MKKIGILSMLLLMTSFGSNIVLADGPDQTGTGCANGTEFCENNNQTTTSTSTNTNTNATFMPRRK